jgi:hypothetical protein
MKTAIALLLGIYGLGMAQEVKKRPKPFTEPPDVQWPNDIAATVEACSITRNSPSGMEVYALVSGFLMSTRAWESLTIQASALLDSASGVKELSEKYTFSRLEPSEKAEFSVGFNHGKLLPGEHVRSCSARFEYGSVLSVKRVDVNIGVVPVAKDEACLLDLIDADSIEGLQHRKKMAELLAYGCIEFAPDHYRASIIRDFEAGRPGHPKVKVVRVSLFKSYENIKIGSDGPLYVRGFALAKSIGKDDLIIEDRVYAVHYNVVQ